MRTLPFFLVGSTLLCSFATSILAQEWTRFRGPNGTGESETILPAKFEASDFAWKTEVPGEGHASPILWGDRLFTLSADPRTATRYVICLDANSGVILWDNEYPSLPHKLHLHEFSSYASSTPAVDEKLVYVAWSTPEEITLLALNHDGGEVWRRNLGRYVCQHGFGTSPILYNDLVIVNNSQDGEKLDPGEKPGQSFLMAFNKNTGADVWKTPLKSTMVSYSVPCVYQNAQGQDELLCLSHAEGVFSVNPENGNLNWSVPDSFTMRTVSSPVIAGGLIYGSTGSGGGGNYAAAIEPASKPSVAFTIRKQAPYVPTPVARGKALFLWSDVGAVTCIDPATGDVHWEGRGHQADFFGSPIRAGDKIYCIGEDGVLVSVAANTDRIRVLGKTPLGELSRTTPAVSGGRMYVRTISHVVCLGNKAS